MKSLIRTAALVVAVLIAAQYVPFVAEHQTAFLIAVVGLGLIGLIGKLFIFLIIAGAIAWFFFPLL